MRDPLISTISSPSAIKPRLSLKTLRNSENSSPSLCAHESVCVCVCVYVPFSFQHFRAKLKSVRAACSRATSSVHYFINHAFLIEPHYSTFNLIVTITFTGARLACSSTVRERHGRGRRRWVIASQEWDQRRAVRGVRGQSAAASSCCPILTGFHIN